MLPEINTEPAEGSTEYRRSLIEVDIEWQSERLVWARQNAERSAVKVREIEAHIARREAELEALPP